MTNYQRFTEELRAAGMDAKAAVFLVNKLKEDEEYSVTTPEEKEWALMRGFFPGRIAFYGLTEENYRDYVPDYHYFMLFCKKEKNLALLALTLDMISIKVISILHLN